MNRHRVRIAAALILGISVLAAAGCGDAPAPPSTGQGDYTAPPLPANADLTPPSTASGTAETECADPTASLRPSTAAQGPNLDAVRARGRLVVGLDPGSNLFSFRDPITGTLAGFDVDIAAEIARDLLGDPGLVEYRILGSADREKALQDHTVDVVVKTMTITCDRREHVDFSTTYLMAHQRVLALRDSGIGSMADLAGKRVCTVGGTTSLDRLHRIQPQAAIMTVPTWADCLVVLQQRQVDAVSTDDAVLAGLVEQDIYAEVTGPPLSDEPYGVGIPKGNDDMVRFVNATLQRLRSDGTWDRLYRQWLEHSLGPTPGPPEPIYRD